MYSVVIWSAYFQSQFVTSFVKLLSLIIYSRCSHSMKFLCWLASMQYHHFFCTSSLSMSYCTSAYLELNLRHTSSLSVPQILRSSTFCKQPDLGSFQSSTADFARYIQLWPTSQQLARQAVAAIITSMQILPGSFLVHRRPEGGRR